MSKRYIVAVDSSTKEQETAFLALVKADGLGWWHWLNNFWLLTDSEGQLSASEIRHKIMETYPTIHCLVIELSGTEDTWAGYGPNTEARDMFKWLKNTWGRYK